MTMRNLLPAIIMICVASMTSAQKITLDTLFLQKQDTFFLQVNQTEFSDGSSKTLSTRLGDEEDVIAFYTENCGMLAGEKPPTLLLLSDSGAKKTVFSD